MATKSSKTMGPGRRQPMRTSKASAPWPSNEAELPRSETFAINFFADAITALPRELVRHFTLLKEVDAKIFLPEAALEQEVEDALEAPIPEQDISQLPPTTASRSGPASLSGSVINDRGSSIEWFRHSNDNFPRRQQFRSLSVHLQDMLVSLDEKNHVISTAVEALNKQIARLDDCYPMINNEISEEARYGNVKHWAYEENRIGRTGAEKTRREAAESTLTAAQQAAAEEIAARSETRKLAVQAKKGKNQLNESDFDDHNDARRLEPAKKLHGNSKIRKAAEASTAIGLGITNGTPINGNPPPKRRKVDKASSNANVGSLANALGANGAGKGKAGSPRETPIPEPKRKGKAAPTTNGTHSRKRFVARGHVKSCHTDFRLRNNTITSIAMSPSLLSSPVQSTFIEAKLSRTSPAPTNGRPPSGRARQNSTHSLLDGTRQRPGSSASSKTNGNLKGSTESINMAEPDQSVLQGKSLPKESEKVELVTENAQEEVVVDAVEAKKDGQTQIEAIDSNINGDGMQGVVLTNLPPAPLVITTRTGRASKPSTPAIPSFPEIMTGGRSGRSSRNQHDHSNISATNSTTSSSSNKRSHKKGAGAAAAAAAQQQAEKDRGDQEQEGLAEQTEEDVPIVDAREDDKTVADNDETLEADPTEIAEEVDEDEPTYCYCNNVSYGEMVGCDSDGCVREWFHLECVGLKVAPKGNGELLAFLLCFAPRFTYFSPFIFICLWFNTFQKTNAKTKKAKWYCDECKEKIKNSKRGRSSG